MTRSTYRKKWKHSSGMTERQFSADSQPPDGPLAVGIGAEQFRHVADGRGLGLDLPAFGGQGGALGLQGCQSASRLVSLTREPCAGLLIRLAATPH